MRLTYPGSSGNLRSRNKANVSLLTKQLIYESLRDILKLYKEIGRTLINKHEISVIIQRHYYEVNGKEQ